MDHAEGRAEPRADTRRQARKSRPSLPFIVELPFLIVIALTLAVVIKTFIVQPFYIPSGSMIPTIEINDRVLVSKLAYRFGTPQRGQIVVFLSPYAPHDVQESLVQKVGRNVAEALGIKTAAADDFIKRIVGLPGETVSIRNNTVYIDGKPLAEPYLPPGTKMADMAPVTIPAGDVWVMGDNRAHSSDSRVFGPIREKDIIGEAIFRIWPLDRLGRL